MCPEFTGNKLADHAITFDLNSNVINFAMKVLKKNGILVMKTFDGSLHKQLYVNNILTRITQKFSSKRSLELNQHPQDLSQVRYSYIAQDFWKILKFVKMNHLLRNLKNRWRKRRNLQKKSSQFRSLLKRTKTVKMS